MANLVKSKTDPSEKNRWATRWDCFERAQELFGRRFDIDVCAEYETAKCVWFIAPPGYPEQLDLQYELGRVAIDNNALTVDWRNNWWCNPPFDQKREFIIKAAEQAKLGYSGMMLLPYEPCTKWFRELVMPHATAIYVPNGRYNFLEVDGVTPKSGVNFPSCFVLWTPHYNGGEAKIIHVEK